MRFHFLAHIQERTAWRGSSSKEQLGEKREVEDAWRARFPRSLGHENQGKVQPPLMLGRTAEFAQISRQFLGTFSKGRYSNKCWYLLLSLHRFQGSFWARFPGKSTAINAEIYCWSLHRFRGWYWARFPGKSTAINAEIYCWKGHRVRGRFWARFSGRSTVINADIYYCESLQHAWAQLHGCGQRLR